MNMTDKRTEEIIKTCEKHDCEYFIVEEEDRIVLANETEFGVSPCFDITFMNDVNLAYVMLKLDADTMTEVQMEMTQC